MGQALSNCLADESAEIECPACAGSGICPECHGEGGWIKDVTVVRTEMKKIKDAEGYDKLVPEVLNVVVKEKKPCTACGGIEPMINVSASTRSASPFHSGIQSALRGPALAGRETWKGSGVCKMCQGAGAVKKFASPTRRLVFDDE